jgi:hypothetical protein
MRPEILEERVGGGLFEPLGSLLSGGAGAQGRPGEGDFRK